LGKAIIVYPIASVTENVAAVPHENSPKARFDHETQLQLSFFGGYGLVTVNDNTESGRGLVETEVLAFSTCKCKTHPADHVRLKRNHGTQVRTMVLKRVVMEGSLVVWRGGL
jgi:hypothetical protein